jgi:hypothetical protein
MKRKNSGMHQYLMVRGVSGLVSVAAALLVWACPTAAGVKQAVEIAAIYLAQPTIGEVDVTPSLNVHIKGLKATQMMLSENPLVTGRLSWKGNVNVDAQGNGVGAGTGTFEVGTWALSSGVPVFTPSPLSGQWETKFEIKGNLNGPYTVKVIGHGVAGEVEGMQFIFEARWISTGVDAYSGEILNPHAKK